MVQQPPFAGSGPTTNGGLQQQPQPAAALGSLVGSQQQPQYSPQATNQNYYQQQQQQQQMIKGSQQQPAQFLPPRLNGLPQAASQQQYSSQQASPQNSGQATQQLESLYNGASMARQAAPVYAPKPTYYSQQSQQQPQQPLYQTAPARPIQQVPFYPQQQVQMQQHSPASLARGLPLAGQQQQQQVNGVGLSVRQIQSPLQANGFMVGPPTHQLSMSPLQVSEQRNQQQMQQLFMSYQQQMNPMSEQLMQQQPGALVAAGGMSHEQLLQQQQNELRWSQLDEQHRLNSGRLQRTQMGGQRLASDRDSVSTLSRANQFDERRSFTMRSQYTNHANQAARYSRNFSFLKLTAEALKSIVGLSGDSQPGDRNNLQRNLSLTVTHANNCNSNKNLPSSFSQQDHASPKVTAIDSGEDHYFKRRVFTYQLAIMRLVNLLCASLVLLSPVAMLLLPKMETILRLNQDASLELGLLAPNDIGASRQSATGTTASITNAVGLTNRHSQQHQAPNFAPAQWRISECSSDCDGPLIGFVARLIMLCVAYWAIFFRAQTASLPRIDFHRCLLSSMALLLCLAYWLFFLFRVFDKRFNDFELQYITIVQFALSLLESLILLHYLAVVLLELRHRKKIYCLKIVRSPDGASQYYSCGALSIQKCAQFVLEKYHRNFQHCGPYAEQLMSLEDQLAAATASERGPNAAGERQSRPSSPHAHSLVGRSASRTSRHRSRSGAADRHRSASNSPEARRPPRRKRSAERASSQVKLYQLDLNPPRESETNQQQQQQNANMVNENGNSSTKLENDSNSADQSSDATSRMKESSLETIKAANSTSDLLSQQQKPSAASKPSGQAKKREDQRQQLQSSRDETESVRSVRSRRSTGRSHHRHREHRRSHRSSSRLDDQSRLLDAEGQDEEPEVVGRQAHHSIRMGPDPIEEHERKLRRRKLRLLAAVQDSFAQIKQIDQANHSNTQHPATIDSGQQQQQHQAKQALGPNQAARSMYPSIARSLQKYLRLTKQTGRHNLQSIYEHLSKCLLYKLSARTFLEKFVKQDPVWQQSETNLFADCKLADSQLLCPTERSHRGLELNSWSLLCDTLLSRQIRSGTFFVLRQGQVSLLVTVAKLPHLNLREQVIDQNSSKFTLGPNSETSV